MKKGVAFTFIIACLLCAPIANASTFIYEFGGIATVDDPNDELGLGANNLLEFTGSFIFSPDSIVYHDDTDYYSALADDFLLTIGEYEFWYGQTVGYNSVGWDWSDSWSVIGSMGMSSSAPLEPVYWYETWLNVGQMNPLDMTSFLGGYLDIVCGTLDSNHRDVFFKGDIEYFSRTPVPEPSTIFLLCTGIIGLTLTKAWSRKRKKK